jgi:hypothetical protein
LEQQKKQLLQQATSRNRANQVQNSTTQVEQYSTEKFSNSREQTAKTPNWTMRVLIKHIPINEAKT